MTAEESDVGDGARDVSERTDWIVMATWKLVSASHWIEEIISKGNKKKKTHRQKTYQKYKNETKKNQIR